jgi:excisionase family DNA binding protein
VAGFKHDKEVGAREQTLAPFAISVEEAERVSAIGRTKLYELLRKGRIKSRKLGRRRLVLVQSLRDFLESEGD